MAIIDAIRYRIRAAFRRKEYDRDIEEELAFHLDLEAAERRQCGDDEQAAYQAARRAVGNVSSLKEELRSLSILHIVDAARQDARYATRMLSRAPIFTLVTILTLALGIGATTAIFSLLYSVLFATLPLRHARDLVQVQLMGQRTVDQFRLGDYRQLRRGGAVPGVAEIAAFSQSVSHVETGQLDDYVGVDLVSDNYFAALGMTPQRGHSTDTGDAARPRITVISDGLWARFFGRNPGAIGQTISIGTASFTIVGIAPPAFNGLGFPGRFDLAIPLEAAALVAPNRSGEDERLVTIIARMRSGVQLEPTGQVLDGLFRSCCARNGLRESMVTAGSGAHVRVRSIAQGIPSAKEDVRLEYRRILILMMCGAASLLIITCVNVANLLLSRAVMRRREFGVRLALGASRSRLVRQCLVESGLLMLGGGLVGLAAAGGALRGLSAQLSAETATRLGPLVELRTSAPILFFAAAASLLTGALFGVAPALRGTAIDPSRSLRDGDRSRGWGPDRGVRKGFVATQFVLSLVLLILAGQFARSLHNLREDDVGFDASHVLAVQVDARGTSYQDQRLDNLYDMILARARALPAVKDAAVASYTPAFGGLNLTSSVTVPGYVPVSGEGSPQFNYVSSDFLATIGARMVVGRSFTEDEGHSSDRVAVVNRAFTRRYFGGENAIGRQFRIPESVRIVGVADDVRFDGPGSVSGPMVFLPFSQWPGDWRYLTLTVRTSGDPTELARAVRTVLHEVAPGIRVQRLTTLEDQLNRTLERQRFAAGLFMIFALIALCLAAVGLYGVVSYLAAGRTAEFGIRLALGAESSAVLWLVARDSLRMSLLGIALGLPAALAASRFAANQLYKVPSADPLAITAAALVLLVVSVLAALVPAVRASRVDPMTALRAN
jgi:predicted permease